MSIHQTLKQGCLALSAFALLLTGSGSLSHGGDGCSPATPCPCAADGVCRPNRAAWGYSKTRWRPWPGDPVAQQLRPGVAPGINAEKSPQFQAPSPEEEGLRTPFKEKREKIEAGAEGIDAGAFMPLNIPRAIPQEAIFPLPSNNDSPPALPASLQQAALSFQSPWRAIKPLKLASTLPRALTLQSPAANSVVPVRSQTPVASASDVQKNAVRTVGFEQQSHSIQLINPASAIISSPESLPLQQAIYYEKTDSSK